MGRRGRVSSCASCALLGFAVAGLLGPAAVKADIADAMPAFKPHPVRGIPRCAANEELCPVSKGSNELHCVDLTDAKTCGGCVTDGDGLDCTSVPGVFMQQCTARGQCTGCRWKHGGMNASLEEPDFLSCSIILTQPVQASRHVPRRAPMLTYAKQLVKEKFAHTGPMPARKPQANYAADQAVAKHHPIPALVPPVPGAAAGVQELPRPHVLQAQRDQILFGNGPGPGQQPLGNALLQPHRGSVKQDSQIVKRDSFPAFELTEIPDPPDWLTAFTGSQLSNLPLTDKDDAILAWFQSIQDGIIKLAVKFHAMSPKEEKKKISNADRFRLKLPPVAPKGLVRPNKPAPFILPGMDYTEEEIEAMGLKDYIQTKAEPGQIEEEETVTVHDHPSVFWGRLMKTAFKSTAKNVRNDVMDALWLLLDEVSRPPDEIKKPAVVHKAQPLKAGGKAGPGVFLPQDVRKAALNQGGKPLQPAKLGLAREQELPGQKEASDKTDNRKPKGPGLLKRPGHLAAEAPNTPAGQAANGRGLTNPLLPLARPGQSKPKALQLPLQADAGAPGRAQVRPGEGFLPQNANNDRLRPGPGRGAKDADAAKGLVPPIVNGRLGSPPKGKAQQLPGFGKEQAQQPLQASSEEEESDGGVFDDLAADPYARERQRPAQKPKADESEDESDWQWTLNADGSISRAKKPKSANENAPGALVDGRVQREHSDKEDTQLRKAAPHEAESDLLADDSVSDEETLLELLALKEQEMAEIQKKIAQRKQRKQADAGQKDMTAEKKQFLDKDARVNPGQHLLKGAKLNKAQQPLQPKKANKLLAPLQPAAPRKKTPVDSGNEFEQHLRQAQEARRLKLEEQIQPEKLLQALENEQLAQGGEGMAGPGKRRPMMAGMAKARPAAHLQPDSNPGRV
ncbi:hypothetical protein P389DRAFT_212769 [Cystobasidium minutum MCA 4210]|uniref:uncharacterized protein n=1 Tax=Cystobasidium minutum MCA 4210 TaxID=1397322 RepID=UPI0034CEB4B9|eukprot:jgi/Rhomi1/212769/estExt_Genemark1.C_70291